MSTELAELVDAGQVIDFCRRLVRAPSENPPGDEREAAAVTQQVLGELGIESELVTSAERRTSVVATYGSGRGASLLFNGHLDVVPALDTERWPHPPYAAEIRDGRLYGRGSSDMKAGIAACLGAVAAWKRGGFTPPGRLVMHFVADEEAMGYQGTKHLLDHGYCDGITEAVVGEPTNMHLVTAERGACWARITTRGVSAHGSTPGLGVNAIVHMARVVENVAGMRWRKLHELLGAPTVNVGTIHSGGSANMVPDHCVIDIDRRTLPGESQEEVVGELQEVLEAVRAQIPDLKAEVDVSFWADASQTPEGTRMVSLIDAARTDLGVEGYELGYSGATDARYLINQAKVPSVIFGPGDLKVAHTTGEFVETAELVTGARVYAHAFAAFFDT